MSGQPHLVGSRLPTRALFNDQDHFLLHRRRATPPGNCRSYPAAQAALTTPPVGALGKLNRAYTEQYIRRAPSYSLFERTRTRSRFEGLGGFGLKVEYVAVS